MTLRTKIVSLALVFVVACGAGRGAGERAKSTGTPVADVGGDYSAALPPTFARDGRTFELAWVDDFEAGLGSAELGNWTFDTNAAWFHPDNVRAENSVLRLELSAADARAGDGRRYLAGEYDRKGEQLYGRFVTRMKPSAPPGVIASFFTAFYKFDDKWEKLLETAEIDIEFVGNTREAQFAIHWVDPGGTKQETNTRVALPFDAGEAFHVWEIEWVEDRIAFYVDGQELHRFDDPDELAEQAIAQEVRANLWISTSVPWAGAFDAAALPVRSEYDWIAAYRLRK
jgi:beta-glucanase (GH16 family)